MGKGGDAACLLPYSLFCRTTAREHKYEVGGSRCLREFWSEMMVVVVEARAVRRVGGRRGQGGGEGERARVCLHACMTLSAPWVECGMPCPGLACTGGNVRGVGGVVGRRGRSNNVQVRENPQNEKRTRIRKKKTREYYHMNYRIAFVAGVPLLLVVLWGGNSRAVAHEKGNRTPYPLHLVPAAREKLANLRAFVVLFPSPI